MSRRSTRGRRSRKPGCHTCRSQARATRGRSSTRRSMSQAEYVASLEYNIKDAKEALRAAISMDDWRGAKKYIAQIEKLQHKLTDASMLGYKRRARDVRYAVGSRAGDKYGRGRLP